MSLSMVMYDLLVFHYSGNISLMVGRNCCDVSALHFPDRTLFFSLGLPVD